MMNDKTDKLEQFVKNNRDAFDLFDPPAGMFNKISDEVEKRKKGKARPMFYLQRVAAVVVILLAAYAVADIANGLRKSNDTAEVSEQNMNSELGEAMVYYTSKIDNKRIELEEQAAEYPEILEEIKREFTQLDEEYKKLENDLKEDVSNQMVIEAMIRTAKIKLEILEKMHQQMQRMENKNIENHEKTQL